MKKETKAGMPGIQEMLTRLQPVKRTRYPLLNWPYCVGHPDPKNTLTDAMIDLRMLETMRNRWNWQWDPETIRGADYQALVVTGTDQVILWASEGFLEMTGYVPAAAIGRKPSFLQGTDTSENSKSLIREAIRNELPVSTTILNYKQDGAPYHCHLELLPLRHLSGRVTHFLALEKEL